MITLLEAFSIFRFFGSSIKLSPYRKPRSSSPYTSTQSQIPTLQEAKLRPESTPYKTTTAAQANSHESKRVAMMRKRANPILCQFRQEPTLLIRRVSKAVRSETMVRKYVHMTWDRQMLAVARESRRIRTAKTYRSHGDRRPGGGMRLRIHFSNRGLEAERSQGRCKRAKKSRRVGVLLSLDTASITPFRCVCQRSSFTELITTTHSRHIPLCIGIDLAGEAKGHLQHKSWLCILPTSRGGHCVGARRRPRPPNLDALPFPDMAISACCPKREMPVSLAASAEDQ